MNEIIKKYIEEKIDLIEQGRMQELYGGLLSYDRPDLTEILNKKVTFML